MTDFQREHRYWAIKRKHLTPEQDEQCRQFFGRLRYEGVPEVECVCVESDWPIYEETWDNVQRLAEGRPSIRAELSAELSRKTDLCTRQRSLEAKLQGEINHMEPAIQQALDLAGDVDWFVRMQGGSDPGLKQVVEKARAFIAEYETLAGDPS